MCSPDLSEMYHHNTTIVSRQITQFYQFMSKTRYLRSKSDFLLERVCLYNKCQQKVKYQVQQSDSDLFYYFLFWGGGGGEEVYVQYNTIQYNTIQYITIQYNTIQLSLFAFPKRIFQENYNYFSTAIYIGDLEIYN